MINKMSILFLGIVLVVAIILGSVVISSLNNKLNEFKNQMNNTGAYISQELPGPESDSNNPEPVN